MTPGLEQAASWVPTASTSAKPSNRNAACSDALAQDVVWVIGPTLFAEDLACHFLHGKFVLAAASAQTRLRNGASPAAHEFPGFMAEQGGFQAKRRLSPAMSCTRFSQMDKNIIAYVGAGSNRGESTKFLARARAAVNDLAGVEVRRVSPIFWTEPQGYAWQPWFANMVMQLEVDPQITPRQLLKELLETEKALGRTRYGPRFGPRVIDLDLLLFADYSSMEQGCTVPHPRMHERAFVLVPLKVLAPGILLYGQPPEYWLSLLNWRLEDNRIYQQPNNDSAAGKGWGDND